MSFIIDFFRIFTCSPRPAHIYRAVLNKGKHMSTVTLNWVLPTTRTDGSSLPPSSIASVNVFDGTVQIGTATGAATTFMTPVLAPGTHVFTVIVVDTLGNMAAPSNAASITAPTAAPSPATNLTATLNP